MDFAQFYRESWEPCLKAVLASRVSSSTAEDQLAEAFARAWASWRSLHQHPAPRAWVVRTAINVGISWWRRRRWELGPYLADDVAVADEDGSLDVPVLNAVRRLPLRERQVVVLRVVLDLDTATTATELGIAPATVRVHLTRAMAALRLHLVPSEPEDADRCPATTR